MNMKINGTAEITHEGIKKHFTKWKNEPLQPIIELIANGFDAGANTVSVTIEKTDLDGLQCVTVMDNGTGINIANCDNHFALFNESIKQGDDDLQGAHGKGRLAFHLICESAIWFTRHKDIDAQISVTSEKLQSFVAEQLVENNQHSDLASVESGTCVVLRRFNKNLPELKLVTKQLENYFGWRLILNPNRTLLVNGKEIVVPRNQLKSRSFDIEGTSFNVNFIRWVNKPGDEKSYNYVVNNEGRVLYRTLSSFNKKPNFYLSTYATSDWFNHFDKNNTPLNLSGNPEESPSSKEFKLLQKEIFQYSQVLYEEFLKEFVDTKIQEFDEKGYFALNQHLSLEEASWRKQNTKNFVRSLYLTEPSIFNNTKEKPLIVLIALIDRLLVSNENDGILDVISNVLDLNEKDLESFSKQIHNSSLENIVSTIEALQRRQHSVEMLKHIMVEHYKEVLETPDLQGIIENNTWLFGNKYSILGAEEDDFQKVAKNLRDAVKNIDEITLEDVENGVQIEGIKRQTDLFMARRRPAFDARGKEVFQCTIIEIKKPAISLNKKHLEQIEEYAQIISQHPTFATDKMKFEIILVGRKISGADFKIKTALKTAENKGEPGLVFESQDGIKGYVKTWGTIFAEFELTNNYLLEKLKIKRKVLDKSSFELLDNLQHN